jgi:trypsin-like peptidase/pre-peptidase
VPFRRFRLQEDLVTIRMPALALPLAAAMLGATVLAAQEPPRRQLDLAAVRRAVVTIRALDRSGDIVASGTGFFVGNAASASAIVVTAAHVLVGASGCSIELSDGQTMRCSVAASDTAKDVVMLQVAGVPPGTLRWGNSTAVEDGDDITVVSNPLGQLPGTMSRGIVSAQRVMAGTKLIQITAPISHGSSGAPVMNAAGEVIGVVRSTIERGQALNFATATDAVRNMMLAPDALSEAQTLLQAPSLARGGVRDAGPDPAGQRVGTDSRDIAVGDSRSGRLTSRDSVYRDSTYYQTWRVRPPAGRTVTVSLASGDFDAYMMIRGGGLDSTLHDDDSGPGCDARIVYRFPNSGPYSIMVNTASAPKYATGDFTLSVAEGSDQAREDRCVNPAMANRPAAGGGTPGRADYRIAVGESRTGRLTSSDSVYSDSTYYQLWSVSPPAGRTVTINLSSSDFDAFLLVRGSDLPSALSNDDAGPGCDARISHTFPSSGPYTILVNTAGRHWATGAFTLSVSEGNQSTMSDDHCPGATGTESAAPTSRGDIGIGDSRDGQLSNSDDVMPNDNTYWQGWRIRARQGQRVTIDLTSTDFDSYLMVQGPGLSRLRDDDSGGNCNSRITVTFPETGNYLIIVNTLSRGETGRYRVSVTAGERPASSAPCNQQ